MSREPESFTTCSADWPDPADRDRSGSVPWLVVVLALVAAAVLLRVAGVWA